MRFISGTLEKTLKHLLGRLGLVVVFVYLLFPKVPESSHVEGELLHWRGVQFFVFGVQFLLFPNFMHLH